MSHRDSSLRSKNELCGDLGEFRWCNRCLMDSIIMDRSGRYLTTLETSQCARYWSGKICGSVPFDEAQSSMYWLRALRIRYADMILLSNNPPSLMALSDAILFEQMGNDHYLNGLRH